MAVVDDYREERAELQSLLASGIFARSPSLAIFLQYICHKYFEGRADEIKEYSVAVEAFGRPADFDQKRDSIVRVEAHRLRRRLSEFYQGAGATHSIQIRIPPGQYAPVFVREHAGAGPAEALPSTKKPQTPDITVVRTQPPVEPPPAPQRWRVLLTAAPILIGVAAMTGWLIRDNWITTASTNPAAPPQPVSSRNAVPLSDEDIRIAAGLMAGRFVDRIGNIWSADRFFKGGEILSVSPRPIARTVDPELYVTRREGDFTYEIPLAPGTYEVRLHFAETVFGEANVAGGGEASRIFQVFANGRELMHEFDVLADAGGSNTANLKVFTNVQPVDGLLRLHFARGFRERAFVNGIEIVRSNSPQMLPIRISARNQSYTDTSRNVWLPDAYFSGGQSIQRHDRIASTVDPELYKNERYGNFSYALPVAENAKYTLTLKFAENWFGEGRTGGGGVGSRVFDVYCNGRTLLRNFDVLKEAGGPLRPIDRVFRGLEPNAQGKLLLQFVPVKNYAMINAIEVVAESK